jgi:hypothetical protein
MRRCRRGIYSRGNVEFWGIYDTLYVSSLRGEQKKKKDKKFVGREFTHLLDTDNTTNTVRLTSTGNSVSEYQDFPFAPAGGEVSLKYL